MLAEKKEKKKKDAIKKVPGYLNELPLKSNFMFSCVFYKPFGK